MVSSLLAMFNHNYKTIILLAGLILLYLIGTATLPSNHLISSIDLSNLRKTSPSVPVDVNEDVAFCVATKDHPDDLVEFFTHHYHHHGIRRFYIMDDGSSVPLSTIKDFGIPRSSISFQYFSDKAHVDNMQLHIYSECMRLFGPMHKWMAFVDADEFFETRQEGETLLTILKELESNTTIGALGVNWRLHSSAGILNTTTTVRQSFTSCCGDPPGLDIPEGWKDSRLIKSIVKTHMFDGLYSPHQFRLKDDARTVGEHGDVMDNGVGVRMPITRDRIALHHYTLKSREQFEAKLNTWTSKDWSYWDHIEGLEQIQCMEMTRYNP